jgi:hypothetical protein
MRSGGSGAEGLRTRRGVAAGEAERTEELSSLQLSERMAPDSTSSGATFGILRRCCCCCDDAARV